MINIDKLTFQFEPQLPAIFENLTVGFKAKSWTCLLGKSGCGKTTLLKRIAGFEHKGCVQSGNIGSGDPHRLDPVAYMGQQDLLFPWLDVLHNVCLESYLICGSITKTQIEQATQLLNKLGLSGYSQHFPHQLSGGMRQRVAIARTLMQDKPVVLMDEPFAALDAVTRYELQKLACQLLKDKTVLFITHDPQEALRIADRILIMKGTPAKLHEVEFHSTSFPPRETSAELVLAHNQLLQRLSIDSMEQAHE
ncbi:ABC transporter ATP-binding protein [Vibrio algicola]|uniref:ATP-binding cassette domain-containing protein n=1 Tax=Vibrio algicola TaxID=2662262 RepID=A0A5Q0TCS4_9VIBR|nr:ABC transporter ATP-binding protein [Vibrio algicola]